MIPYPFFDPIYFAEMSMINVIPHGRNRFSGVAKQKRAAKKQRNCKRRK